MCDDDLNQYGDNVHQLLGLGEHNVAIESVQGILEPVACASLSSDEEESYSLSSRSCISIERVDTIETIKHRIQQLDIKEQLGFISELYSKLAETKLRHITWNATVLYR